MKLEKRSNGIWYARMLKDGRWIRRSLKTGSKSEALRAFAELREKPESERLAQAVRRWADEQEERDLTEKHLADIRRAARAMNEAFGGLLVHEVKRGALLEWLRLRPRKLRLTRAFFRWAIAEDLRTTDPCMGAAAYLQRPEVRRTPRLTDSRIEALLADLKTGASALEPLVRFLSVTGVRSVDATRLRWKDVGQGRALIRPGRGKGHTRLIPIPELGLERGEDEALVFGMTKGKLEGAWRRFKYRNPKWRGTSLHSLRVSVNSRLVEQGNEALARAMLGHASVDMTAHYTRLVGE